MGTRPMQSYLGRCHCGAVQFRIETDFPELTTCDCSICRRKNALMVKVHESRFVLLAGADSLTEYRFHTGTARHYFCKVCGIWCFFILLHVKSLWGNLKKTIWTCIGYVPN